MDQSKKDHKDHDHHDDQKQKLEGLPMKDSPYLQYDNLEDYKKKGYGTKGHLEPKPGRGAGASVDAPTHSGGSVTATTDTVNRQGAP